MGRLTVKPARTISTGVYDILQEDILQLRRKPGESIDSNEIAADLSVSRAPVRDALIKLERDGLVDIFPQRGTYVSRINLKRVDEECFLRRSLELSVLPLFLKQCGSDALSQFSKCILLQKQALEDKDYVSLQEYDDAFHSVFFLAAHKELCWSLIQSASGHYKRIRLLSLWEHDISAGVVEEHEEILRTVRLCDEFALAELMCSHLSRLVVQEGLFREKHPDYFTDDSGAPF